MISLKFTRGPLHLVCKAWGEGQFLFSNESTLLAVCHISRDLSAVRGQWCLMRFRSGGGGPEPRANKELLRHLGCKKVTLLKHGDRTRGQEELHWGGEE